MLDAWSLLSFCLSLVWVLAFRISCDVMAQETDAVCMEQFGWMRNSLGQSPCLVEAFVEGACHSDGDWSIPAAQSPASIYPGPSKQSANKCSCSSVAFSLLSACAFCQGASLDSWSNYIVNCSADNITNPGYPHDIPEGTTVPSWAFAAVDTDVDQWSSENAKNLAFSGAPDFSSSDPPPESGDSQISNPVSSPADVSSLTTGVPSSRTSSPPRSSPTTNHFVLGSAQPIGSQSSIKTGATTLPPNPTAGGNPNTSSNNTSAAGAGVKPKIPVGAVVGGVIGGIMGLLSLCAAAVYYRYLRTPRVLHSRQGSVSTNGTGNSQSSYGRVDEKYLEPPNSAGLPISPLSIYDPFRSTSVTSLPNTTQKDEEADLDNRFFNVPPPHAVPDVEFTHAV